MKNIFQLLQFTLREKRKLALSFVFTIFVALFTYVFVNLVQPIMDNMLRLGPEASAEPTGFMSFIYRIFHVGEDEITRFIPLILLVVIFGKGLFTFLSDFIMKAIGHKTVNTLRNDLYEHLINQSSYYFDRHPTGELMSRMTSDVDKIQQAVSGNMGDLLQSAFVILALLLYIFITDWRLALASFIIAPLAIVPLAVFSRYLKKRGKQNQVRMAEIFRLLHETITGNKIVKAFTMENFELKKFFEATRKYFKTSIKLAWIGSLSSPFMEFLGGAVGAFVLIVGSNRIVQGHISPGDFGSFVFALFQMYTPIRRISRANNVIQQGVACYERVQEILDCKPQVMDRPNAYPLPAVKGEVVFDGVSFGYDETQPVLKNVSFKIEPTQVLALIGLSGSGKTTIINLLSRFYDPSGGRIFIDGIDIQEVSLNSLRSQIGLVTQELILFDDTVKNNIAYGLGEITHEKVEAAARAAMAHGFIEALPYGYDTQIGEKGGLLSSGQRQRLAIARALLKDPPILILDEATSALDSESERLIQIALENATRNRTTLIIAHRLSTIRNADRILVVDKGKIVEQGDHGELYRLDGLYRKLYDLQFPEEMGEPS